MLPHRKIPKRRRFNEWPRDASMHAGVARRASGLRACLRPAWTRFLAHLILDVASDTGVNVLPVLEGVAQHRLAHAAEQAAGSLVNQLCSLPVVEHAADQNAGLAKIIAIARGVKSLRTASRSASQPTATGPGPVSSDQLRSPLLGT